MLLLLSLACSGNGFSRGDIGIDTGTFVECDERMDEPVEAGFEEELDADGCRWRVAATDEDGYTLLLLDVPAFADALEGESVSTTYTLPDETVVIELTRGCVVSADTCGTDGADPIPVYTYEATAGTVAVDVTPDTDDTALATIVLTGVVFEPEYGSTVTVDTVTWTDVYLYGGPPE